jgi:competence protein ComEA
MFRPIKDYLTFSRSEKNGLIILGIVFILIVLLNFSLPYIIISDKKFTTQEITELNKIVAILNDSSKSYDSSKYKKNTFKIDSIEINQLETEENKTAYFVFDPNTISVEGWRKLNVPEKAIKNISKYRQKGGRFYKPDDLKKIYGFNIRIYENLEPYIKINTTYNNNTASYKNNTATYKNNTTLQTKKIFTPRVINKVELNSATEIDLDKLPAIGESYSKRIVKYRQMLGGYYKREQLLEVYGLDTSVYNKIKDLVFINDAVLAKIAINLADSKELGKHPYIGYKIANKIIDRRDLKGPFKNIQEIKEVIGDDLYNKVYPYLKLWD